MKKYIQKFVSFITALFKSFSAAKQKERSKKGTEAFCIQEKETRGISRRLDAHARSCRQAYAAKAAQVAAGKGRNSMRGIPAHCA